MKGTLTDIIVGLVVYIVAQSFIDSMITGTSSGDVLIQTVVPIVIAAAVVLGVLAVKAFRGG